MERKRDLEDNMEIFRELPDSLKSLIFKKAIRCPELTNDGKMCGEKFKYSVREHMFSKENLNEVMIDCTKFCLRHITDLIINGELLLGYETKNETENKGILNVDKRIISITGFKDDFNVKLEFIFLEPIWAETYSRGYKRKIGKVTQTNFTMPVSLIEDKDDFIAHLLSGNDRVGHPVNFDQNDIINDQEDTTISFNGSHIDKYWEKIIIRVFKNMDSCSLNIKATTTKRLPKKIINGTLALGNIDKIEVSVSGREIRGFKNIIS